ncbi:MAG: hypothetical protein WAS21_32635 [Geminicoccaceae bacterium]
MRWTRKAPFVWTATMGVSLLLLALWLVAEAGAVGIGGGWPRLAMALDPAVSGSIPDLWALLQLVVAAVTACCLRRCGPAAAVLLVLAVADGGDMTARLAPLLSDDPALAKLVASTGLGAAALAPTVLMWRRSCFFQRRLGRRLAVPLLAWGVTSVGFDALGSGLADACHWLTVAEEAIELLLYAALAMRLLDSVLCVGGVSAERPILVH